MDVQLKSTKEDTRGQTDLTYELGLKNYVELRDPRVSVYRILIVVILPAKVEDWYHHTEHELSLRHCAYWCSLRDEPETTNKSTVTVRLQRDHMFTPESLTEMMRRIDKGEAP